ncbi:hypothetical protein J132_05094, partial [Termitomyces sp. J132]
DIICLQEPYYNFNKQFQAMQKWHPVYPKNHKENKVNKSRAMMLVNRRLMTDSWTRLSVNSVDMVAMRVETKKHMLQIFNVYNVCNHLRSVRALKFFLNS